METLELRMATDMATAIPTEIAFNFEELEAKLQQQLHHYNQLVVTEDSIKEAKEDLVALRKLRDALETRRKEVKKQCEVPYKAFEAKEKRLVALIDSPISAINDQVKKFEEQVREQKRSEIETVYDELVPENIREIIPLTRIMDPRWLNKTTSMKSIREEITTIAKRTKLDIIYINAAVDPKYLTAVRSEYIRTLDIDKALDHRDALIATESKFQRHEAELTVCQPPAAEKPPESVQESGRQQPIHQPHREEKLHDLTLAFQITQHQATALKQFLEANHIQYKKIV